MIKEYSPALTLAIALGTLCLVTPLHYCVRLTSPFKHLSLPKESDFKNIAVNAPTLGLKPSPSSGPTLRFKKRNIQKASRNFAHESALATSHPHKMHKANTPPSTVSAEAIKRHKRAALKLLALMQALHHPSSGGTLHTKY